MLRQLLYRSIDARATELALSMDSRGRWRDKVFVERVWKSIQYAEVSLHAYASVAEARASPGRSLEFYNSIRPHTSLKAQTPDPRSFTCSVA
jgi:putative transposase